MLVNKSLPALYNGVSQQPPTLRLPSQGEVQVNGFSSVVDGQRKRPPTEHLALLTGTDLSGAYLHTINRDVTERYLVVLTDGDLRVFDLDGNEKTVAFPNGKAYLDVTNPRTDFVCITVADYTFIVNTTVHVQMGTLASDQSPQATNRYWLGRELADEAAIAALQEFVAQQIQYPSNPAGGTFRGVKQSFSELPETPADGDIWQIRGTADSGFATYYVRRVGGTWEETVKPGIYNRINAETMPWALVRKADGTFDFAPFSWADRRVGDETTNPNPTFVGRTINDVFFYKNRLGFAVDEGVVLSRAGDFGNFYRLTVLDLLDDAVVDVAASETKVTLIRQAVPFQGGMMLFSDQVQFRLTHGDFLTPTSASLDVVTQFRMTPGVRPLPIGGDVYFPTDDNNWSAIREYYVRDDTGGNDAGNVTAHVPRYIPAGVFRLAGSDTHDILFAITGAEPSRLYAYRFYWANESEKAQSAWSYWEFAADTSLLSVDVLDNYAYLVVKRADGAYLERMSLESGAVAPGLSFEVLLDRRTAVTGTWLPADSKTEFTLPYPVAVAQRASFRLVRGPDFAGAVGGLISIDPDDYEWISSTVVRVVGRFDDGECFAGLNYEHRFEFSQQFIKNRENVPVVSGRLQLRTWRVYFVDTAYFKVEIAPYGSDPDVEEVYPAALSEFDGKTLGASTALLGAPNFQTGAFAFSVWGDATVAKITLVNDTPYQATFQQAEWEGFYHNRSRTI